MENYLRPDCAVYKAWANYPSLIIHFSYLIILFFLLFDAAHADNNFTVFESGQVRPLAFSPNKKLVFAVNTPDNRLEVLKVDGNSLQLVGSISVGLEPVAVAAKSNTQVWVVNHLSDSVSIVKINTHVALNGRPGSIGEVSKTLYVGDEPRDIVFAGDDRNRAFITTAHRGQNIPFDPQFTTPGIGRADVWVFDTDQTGSALGGTPLNIISFFADTPRALEVSEDGKTVYAAAFHSGNQTTTLFEHVVSTNGGLPDPTTDYLGVPQPKTSLIVKYNGSDWVDNIGRPFTDQVRFNLPDIDVVKIDATANPPALVPTDGDYKGIGTILFNMVINPVNGDVYVSNTDANNLTRFEGEGVHGGSTVRGHIYESRITVIKGNQVLPRHLNKHIDYTHCCDPSPNAESVKSLAFPMSMEVSEDGEELYVAAYGSQKIGVFKTQELADDSFVPSENDHIQLNGGGPSGILLDDTNKRLYVMTRFNNSISVIDTQTRSTISEVSLFNPEPANVVEGRKFLYDANLTSSHGDSACASCHVFGDLDSAAWDLGDPDITTQTNYGPFTVDPLVDFNPLQQQILQTVGGLDLVKDFRALRGPMSTQSLRGMANHGPMHWRGDRNGGAEEDSIQPDSGTFNEELAFKKFNVAFPGLNGRSEELSEEQMQAFTDFVLQITYPPNPVRNLDNSLTEQQQIGRDFYFGPLSDTNQNCNGCHVLDLEGNAEYGVSKPGFFGTDGQYSFENETQILKIPHLRNLYQKVGMFGQAQFSSRIPSFPVINDTSHMGDQIRGFGFLHDGSFDTLYRFMTFNPFVQRIPDENPFSFVTLFPNPEGIPFNFEGVVLRRNIEQFLLAFDSNLAPIVGQQVTFGKNDTSSDIEQRVGLLLSRADADECDLIVKAQGDGREKGYLYQPGTGQFTPDQLSVPSLSGAALLSTANKQNLTFTCTPPGSGIRMALDRNADGILDGDQ